MARDYDDVRFETMPIPRPGPHDALVRVRACGICTGDVTPWYIKKKCPIVLGHEPAGEIVEVGAQVTRFQAGDRVFIHHHAPCFACRSCRRGFYSMCPTWRQSNLVPGGAAEFTLVPQVNLEGGHYLRIGIALQLIDKVTEADGSKALDATIEIFSGRSITDLNDPKERQHLQEELAKQLDDLYDGEVMDVYFTEFVTQ